MGCLRVNTRYNRSRAHKRRPRGSVLALGKGLLPEIHECVPTVLPMVVCGWAGGGAAPAQTKARGALTPPSSLGSRLPHTHQHPPAPTSVRQHPPTHTNTRQRPPTPANTRYPPTSAHHTPSHPTTSTTARHLPPTAHQPPTRHPLEMGTLAALYVGDSKGASGLRGVKASHQPLTT